ncbi:hypothetical protein DSCW_35640 [Desulfosarcina widdelii]|uniref:Uncharacterized protein n=1 Tax=Desulfosarcina widdelii TaxID=947919 RepID=A0A5K7ZJ99_9BACT|nr:hypothetical protein [Desulfosarcina widdelii]BBO76147.1 hypothetical protein DSCW_35640 [Desulfosarcina widdelii]
MTTDGTNNVPGDGKSDDYDFTDSNPKPDGDGVLRGEDGRPCLKFDNGPQAEPEDPVGETIERFGESAIDEVRDFIKEFRDDENGECDLRTLERNNLYHQPEVVAGFVERLDQLRELKKYYDAESPHTAGRERFKYKSMIRGILLAALEDGKSRFVKKHGPLSM